jgi:hypothetical protein
MDCFRTQLNMPIEVLKKKVKTKWNVDVHRSSLYRARKKAQEVIYGNFGEQYYCSWDYCATIRSFNVGSCVLLMVERPMPKVPCRFQMMYISLAAMKNGFKDGCRPMTGIDACFLKRVYKGQLMASIGKCWFILLATFCRQKHYLIRDTVIQEDFHNIIAKLLIKKGNG